MVATMVPVNLTVYSCTLTLTLTLTALTHEHRRTRRSTDDACNGASLGSLSTSELPGWCQEPERYSAARCANAKQMVNHMPSSYAPAVQVQTSTPTYAATEPLGHA